MVFAKDYFIVNHLNFYTIIDPNSFILLYKGTKYKSFILDVEIGCGVFSLIEVWKYFFIIYFVEDIWPGV